MTKKKTYGFRLLIAASIAVWTACFTYTDCFARSDYYVVMAGKRAVRTVLVSPKSTASASGTALLDALNAITDASETNPYLLVLEPGIYDLGGESLQMKSHVDVQGSGENVTKITGNRSSTRTGVLRGAENAELRLLTVEHVGGGTYAYAVYNNEASLSMKDVTLIASGATDTNLALYNEDCNPVLTNVTIRVTGGDHPRGIDNHFSYPTINNIDIEIMEGESSGSGIFYNIAGGTITNGTILVSGNGIKYGITMCEDAPDISNMKIIVRDGTSNTGLSTSGTTPTLSNVIIEARYGSETNRGIFLSGSDICITNATITVEGGVNSYGIYKNFPSILKVYGSTITAYDATNNYGIWNKNGISQNTTTLELYNCVVTGKNGTNSYGIYSEDDNAEGIIAHSTVSALDGTNNYGVYSTSLGTVLTINDSLISGSTNTVYSNGEGSMALIGGTGLLGGAVGGAEGTRSCAGVYDEDYSFYTDTCP